MANKLGLSRDAQIMLVCLFSRPMGEKMRLTFARPAIIHPRALHGLAELTVRGILEMIPVSDKELSHGGIGWRPLNLPRRGDYPRLPGELEAFPMTTERGLAPALGLEAI